MKRIYFSLAAVTNDIPESWGPIEAKPISLRTCNAWCAALKIILAGSSIIPIVFIDIFIVIILIGFISIMVIYIIIIYIICIFLGILD